MCFKSKPGLVLEIMWGQKKRGKFNWCFFFSFHIIIHTVHSVSTAFKGSLTCWPWYRMWTCVSAAVHIITCCPYVCNRCALQIWGAMQQATSSPVLSLLTCRSEHYVCRSVSCWIAHIFNYLPVLHACTHSTALSPYILHAVPFLSEQNANEIHCPQCFIFAVLQLIFKHLTLHPIKKKKWIGDIFSFYYGAKLIMLLHYFTPLPDILLPCMIL